VTIQRPANGGGILSKGTLMANDVLFHGTDGESILGIIRSKAMIPGPDGFSSDLPGFTRRGCPER
jgi:hypothetical protein